MWQASRWLNLLAGGLWVFVAVMTPILLNRWSGPRILIVSTGTDTSLFGDTPEHILATNADLTLLRQILMYAMSGLMFPAGVLTIAVAWFGMREPTTWSLAVLTIVAVGLLPYWWITLAPYRDAGIHLSLSDIPPFMWVPSILMPIASLLGWIARTGA